MLLTVCNGALTIPRAGTTNAELQFCLLRFGNVLSIFSIVRQLVDGVLLRVCGVQVVFSDFMLIEVFRHFMEVWCCCCCLCFVIYVVPFIFFRGDGER